MTTTTENKKRYEVKSAERWGPIADSRDGDLFRRCGELLMAARAFEGAASARRSPEIDSAVLGCFGDVLHSLATVSLLLRGTPTPLRAGQAPEHAKVAHIDRALFVINQNLRFAAGAAGIGHQEVVDEDQPADGDPKPGLATGHRAAISK